MMGGFFFSWKINILNIGIVQVICLSYRIATTNKRHRPIFQLAPTGPSHSTVMGLLLGVLSRSLALTETVNNVPISLATM
jgi:hypothetical protein